MGAFKDFDKIQILLADIDVASIRLDRIANQAGLAATRNVAANARRVLVGKLTDVLAGLRCDIKNAEAL